MKRGFTLIELSIVLIIIGLLVGGVLAGRDLIQAAKLRGIHTQLNEYRTVTLTFQLKYDALPGDMDNATSFWSGTENGNGNWALENVADGERFDFWQHLALSGMIPGSYPGTGSTSSGFNPPTNVPGLNGFEGGGVHVTEPTGVIDNHSFQATGSEDSRTNTPLLASVDAKQLDTKFDDGTPYSGQIFCFNARNGDGDWLDTCMDYGPEVSWAAATAPWDYDLTSSAIGCVCALKAEF